MREEAIPTASFLDNVLYALLYVIPIYFQGIFIRNRFWVSLWTRFHCGGAPVRFVSHLRRKYRSSYLYIGLPRNKSLLILDVAGIQKVLDYSPVVYADPPPKRKGMSHFQPNALTISRGADWEERRRFNDAVVGPAGAVYTHANHLLEIIKGEVNSLLQALRRELVWEDFDRLFEQIALKIIFGKEVDDSALTRSLAKMMHESNRIVALKKSKYFDSFYEKIRNYLKYPPAMSLVSLCAAIPSTEATRVENQIPHWMFAIRETLAINTVNAFALIVSHPRAEKQVRDEMSQTGLGSAQGIQQLKYLEGCIQEAMRLWPSTPILSRETLVADILGGAVVPPGTQVLILNSFNHRDRETHPSADRFEPERWLDGRVDYHFNHLSNGSQGCAGKDFALFIAKVVLATLLGRDSYVLTKPALNPSKAIPYGYNHFAARFRRGGLAEKV